MKPVTALMLSEDYENLYLERRLCTLSTVRKARENQTAFCTALDMLPEDRKSLVQAIDDYYSYLQTMGYKLAHFFGFQLADHFLPHVIPGYVNDPVNSFHYLRNLEDSLQMDLRRME